jgi:hypothetical protein
MWHLSVWDITVSEVTRCGLDDRSSILGTHRFSRPRYNIRGVPSLLSAGGKIVKYEADHLEPRLRMRDSLPPLPLYSFMA